MVGRAAGRPRRRRPRGAHHDGGRRERAVALQQRRSGWQSRASRTVCELPLAPWLDADDRGPDAPAFDGTAPAVHGRLRDARRRSPTPRTWCRRPSCAGRGVDRDARSRDPRAYLVPDRHPAVAQPAPHARRGSARTTSGPGCPSRCHRAGRGRRRGAGRHRCRLAMLVVLETLTPDRARGVRAARGVRRSRTTRSPRRVERVRRSPCGRSATGPASTCEARRPRVASTAPARRGAERFPRPPATGDLQELMDVLAPDVVLVTDGGGG